MSRLGRASSALPEEYMLSHFLQNVKNPQSSWNTNNTACAWYAVKCNVDREVTVINWFDLGLQGTLHWRCLPRGLKKLYLPTNDLTGLLVVEELPRNMRVLDVCNNKFFGNLNFRALPDTMQSLTLAFNNFDGHIELNHLPSQLKNLCLSHNPNLEGEVDMSAVLPDFQFFSEETMIKQVSRKADTDTACLLM